MHMGDSPKLHLTTMVGPKNYEKYGGFCSKGKHEYITYIFQTMETNNAFYHSQYYKVVMALKGKNCSRIINISNT